MAGVPAPAFVRAGLLATGLGLWGAVPPLPTIHTLKHADSRTRLINPNYAVAVQRHSEAMPGWRRQVVEWLLEVRVLAC